IPAEYCTTIQPLLERGSVQAISSKYSGSVNRAAIWLLTLRERPDDLSYGYRAWRKAAFLHGRGLQSSRLLFDPVSPVTRSPAQPRGFAYLRIRLFTKARLCMCHMREFREDGEDGGPVSSRVRGFAGRCQPIDWLRKPGTGPFHSPSPSSSWSVSGSSRRACAGFFSGVFSTRLRSAFPAGERSSRSGLSSRAGDLPPAEPHPPISNTGIFISVSFSTLAIASASSGDTKVKARPLAPARPVRPIRWT